MRSACQREEGVTIVEVAFLLPALFILVFGLIDLGLWVFDSTQAHAAARDGARAAILSYLNADVPGSADRAAVRAALTGHVDVPAPTVAVRCVRSDATGVACAQAVPGEDRIEVQVSWSRRTVTFVGDLFGDRARRVSATSSMVINGRPAPLP